ncbi:low molecular weight protein-tyrosine-phosphatase [Sanguibacter antarcticus]|uniref:protein-tyrosine-phosphatase n=1 Tax=Sanguibacter antarcticus TaxID=372484 RepID=A0A2A9E7Y5_9MICO|nr:low molecular weight protein-tyrosine-phosphatase [Sanguibacter antarcticus]PFG34766.1 protein-tyrosine phosphatase [Sanguibacter antarcticus]
MTAPLLRIMTVCTGNICRSPMAEIVLRERLDAAGLGEHVVVDSTGVTSEEVGNPIDRRARAVLVAAGYSDAALDAHRARRTDAADLAERDLVLAMTTDHARVLRRLAETSGTDGGPAQIRMFRSFDPQAPRVTEQRDECLLDVEDPWYGGPADFEGCLDQVEAAVDGIVEHVRAHLAGRGTATAPHAG